MLLRQSSLIVVTTLAISCAEAERCYVQLDPSSQVCAVRSPCTVALDAHGTFTISGDLPDGITVTATGLEGTPTEVGNWPLSIELTSSSGEERCEPVTATFTFAFSTVERECLSNVDCTLLGATLLEQRDCSATRDCEHGFCVPYMSGGRCVGETPDLEPGDCPSGDLFGLTSIEGERFNTCSTAGTCSSAGQCD